MALKNIVVDLIKGKNWKKPIMMYDKGRSRTCEMKLKC